MEFLVSLSFPALLPFHTHSQTFISLCISICLCYTDVMFLMENVPNPLPTSQPKGWAFGLGGVF
jgi:hypothetical protein